MDARQYDMRSQPGKLVHASVINARRAAETRTQIKQYFRDHVGVTRQECAAALGLSLNTVCKHVNVLRREWER